MAARNGSLFVVLVGSVIWFEYGMRDRDASAAGGDLDRTASDIKGKGREMDRPLQGFWIRKRQTWTTCDNYKGEPLTVIAMLIAAAESDTGIPRSHRSIDIRRIIALSYTRTSTRPRPAHPPRSNSSRSDR